MSGICGLFNLDDAPVADANLRAMTAMLEQRGPERTGRWRDGPAGLGHTLLATTPELLLERQPFRHADTGCVITADVRIDNREELLDALNIRDRSDSIGDAALMLLTTCVWPGCTVHALDCEADHARTWKHHGATGPRNGLPLCKRHNLHKEHHHCTARRGRHGDWTIHRPDGTPID